MNTVYTNNVEDFRTDHFLCGFLWAFHERVLHVPVPDIRRSYILRTNKHGKKPFYVPYGNQQLLRFSGSSIVESWQHFSYKVVAFFSDSLIFLEPSLVRCWLVRFRACWVFAVSAWFVPLGILTVLYRDYASIIACHRQRRFRLWVGELHTEWFWTLTGNFDRIKPDFLAWQSRHSRKELSEESSREIWHGLKWRASYLRSAPNLSSEIVLW